MTNMSRKEKRYRLQLILVPITAFLVGTGLAVFLPMEAVVALFIAYAVGILYWQYSVELFRCPECGNEIPMSFGDYLTSRTKINPFRWPSTKKLVYCPECRKELWVSPTVK